MLQYIYLLREREFIRLDESTYKIGKTTQDPQKRFDAYPKGSEVLFYLAVEDCHDFERRLLATFRAKFQLRREYGSEYFQGQPVEMMLAIMEQYKEHQQSHTAAVAAVLESVPTPPESDSEDVLSGTMSEAEELLFNVPLPEKQTYPPDVMPFGQHRGMKLADLKILDEQYLRWLMGTLDVDNPLYSRLQALGIKPKKKVGPKRH